MLELRSQIAFFGEGMLKMGGGGERILVIAGGFVVGEDRKNERLNE